MSQDCCSMTLLTFRPLSTSQLATLSMSTSTSQSVELVVDVNVAVSGASCRQRLSVSSVVTPFLMTSHSVLRRRQNWRHISIFILKLYHIWITLSLVLQCCTSDFVSLSLSFCNTQKTLPQMHCSSSLITLALVSSFPYYLQPSDVSIWSIFFSLSLFNAQKYYGSSTFFFFISLHSCLSLFIHLLPTSVQMYQL